VAGNQTIGRRDFLKRSLFAASALGTVRLAGPARGAVLGANDRIGIGIIGCGGMGTEHIRNYRRLSEKPELNIRLVGVCDIYEPRKQRAKAAAGCEVYHDYRKLLERKDLDGVLIATPDHWHAKMAIDAMEAGKDVHVEKPMTLYLDEAKKMVEVAAKTKRVVQVGAEGTSNDVFWQANRIVREGVLGKIVWATGGVYRNEPQGDWNWPMDKDCSPKNLDWDAFLGPAPKRPFEPERYFRYRKYWDYSGGLAHDLIAHQLSALQLVVGPEFPRRISAAGGVYVHHDRETPDTFHMMVEYPSDYVATLFCTQTTTDGVEMAIRGEHATLTFEKTPGREGGARRFTAVLVQPQEPFEKEVKPLRIEPAPRADHDTNWIECMRSRRKPHYPVEMGYKVMAALCLGVRSWREGKMFTFDAAKQEVLP
jgi:predicted dehydrogenase